MKTRWLFEQAVIFILSVLIIAGIGYIIYAMSNRDNIKDTWILAFAYSISRLLQQFIEVSLFKKWKCWDDVPESILQKHSALEQLNAARRFERGIL